MALERRTVWLHTAPSVVLVTVALPHGLNGERISPSGFIKYRLLIAITGVCCLLWQPSFQLIKGSLASVFAR